MPGELKNLVSLAISSGGSSKCHQQQQRRLGKKKNLASLKEERRGGGQGVEEKKPPPPKDGSSGRFTKLLSRSSGTVSTSITASSGPFTSPPLLPNNRKAPVASPESEASSLLNGGSSCASVGGYSTGQEFTDSLLLQAISEDTPRLPSNRRVITLDSDRSTRSLMNGAGVNGSEKCLSDDPTTENDRSCVHHHTENCISRNDDDECQEQAHSSTIKETATEQSRGWYLTRKSYRSVAYKTWTVGAARKLLLNSRSDYDLPPSMDRMGNTDGSASDGEEKYYTCRSRRDDDLSVSEYCTSRSQRTALSPFLDIKKLKARKCASSDAVTLFSTVNNDCNTILSPVDSVPSTSSDNTFSLITHPTDEGDKSTNKDNGNAILENLASRSAATGNPGVSPGMGSRGALTETENHGAMSNGNHIERSSLNRPPSTSKSSGRSWLLMASSSSDDVWKHHGRRSVREKGKKSTNSTGDCFSSEDYFKFTLKKRLQQQLQRQCEPQERSMNGEFLDPPLTLDDFDHPVCPNTSGGTLETRSYSPTTLSSLMAAAQQCWRQQSERFARKIERTSWRGKTDHRMVQTGEPCYSPETRTSPAITNSLIRIPPLNMSSSPFSSPSSSSSSSSMSWISTTKPRNPALSPLIVSVDPDELAAPSDPLNEAINIHRSLVGPRSIGRATVLRNGPSSPFRTSEDAVKFLKQELASIRKKDHQILSQLKKLDAEISRRKSETDALASVPFDSGSGGMETAAYLTDGLSTGPKIDQTSGQARPDNPQELNGDIADSNFDPHHNSVPCLPPCLQVNFKTL